MTLHQGRPVWNQTEDQVRHMLKCRNPRLRVVHDAWWGHFGGDASAPDLIRYLRDRRGFDWANVHRTTMLRWMKQVMEVRHNALLK